MKGADNTKMDKWKSIPETDEEAKVALQDDCKIAARAMIGLYEIHREEGKSVQEALKLVLEARLGTKHSAPA